MKISIITVCLNAENEIERTILSVLNQKYENIEFVLIDGASNDETVNIIKKYEDKIACFISEPDKGIYNAMNKGIEKSTGDFLVFLNAGDEFYNDFVISNLAKAANDNKDAKLIFGNCELHSKEGLPLEIITHKEINSIFSFMHYNFCHQSCFYHKSLFENKKYDEAFKIAGDTDFNLNYVIKNNFLLIYYPEILSKFYLGGISNSKATRKSTTEEHRKIIYEFYKDNLFMQILYSFNNFMKRYFNSIFKNFVNFEPVKKTINSLNKKEKYKLNVKTYCN